jgi:site-specific DNA-methyltransferase (adenine-specific)
MNPNFSQTTNMPTTKQDIEDQISTDFEQLVLDRSPSPAERKKDHDYLNDTISDRSKSANGQAAERRQRALRIFQNQSKANKRLTEEGATSFANYRRLLKFFKPEDPGFDVLRDHIIPCRDHLVAYEKYGEVEKKEFGEVMTPGWLAGEMLDTLPAEMWTNPNIKILDPANGCGIFPIEVVRRLFLGLADKLPDPTERYWHIMKNNVFVCDIQAKNNFLYKTTFDPNDNIDMNIHHGSFLDETFDHTMKNIWKVEKFDVVIGNPPYQEPIPGNRRMRPLYNKFTGKSIAISEKVLFVTPSRWFSGSADLKKFKNFMTAKPNRIKLIKTFDEKQEIFGKGVDIKGGVSYFLYDRSNNSPCLFNGRGKDLNEYDIIIETQLNEVIHKVKKYNKLTEITKTKNTFGIGINDSRFRKTASSSSLAVHVSKAKGGKKFIDKNQIKNVHLIGSWKVLTPAGAWAGGSGLGNLVLAKSDEVHSETYFSFNVETQDEAENLISYLKTGFVNVMVSLRKNTQNIKPSCCDWVPLLPLDRIWDDASVCEYLDLTEEEISLIEETAANIKGVHR